MNCTSIDQPLGQLEEVDGRWQVRFERQLPHPPERVWRAITDPDELQAWFPCTIDGERRSGAPVSFTFPHDEAPVMQGTIVTYEPPHLFVLDWGGDLVTIRLEAVDGGTHLTLVDVVDEVGKAARDGAGWHACLDELRYALAGEAPPYPEGARWSQVAPAYKDAFPAAATTIGPPDWHPEADRA